MNTDALYGRVALRETDFQHATSPNYSKSYSLCPTTRHCKNWNVHPLPKIDGYKTGYPRYFNVHPQIYANGVYTVFNNVQMKYSCNFWPSCLSGRMLYSPLRRAEFWLLRSAHAAKWWCWWGWGSNELRWWEFIVIAGGSQKGCEVAITLPLRVRCDGGVVCWWCTKHQWVANENARHVNASKNMQLGLR